MFDIDSWLSTLNEDYHRPKSTLRKFKLGNVEVRVLNYDNEELQIDEVKFQITPDGELDVHTTGQKHFIHYKNLKTQLICIENRTK